MPPHTMEAIQFDKKKVEILLIKAPLPTEPVKNEVIVQVAFAGICGTDLHIAEGAFPCCDAPVILGHEFSGVVSAVGSEVTHLKPGDHVVVDPNSGCYRCEFCHGGKYHYCKVGGINNTVGIWNDGGWAQYCKVAAEQVHKLPDNITLEQAALTEPLSCISHGWDRISPIPVGSRILILGAGIIGNLWASVLHLQGHRRVTVSEPQEARRKLFEKLETGFDIITPDELKSLHTKDPNWGVDLVIECSGYAPAMEEALTLIKPGGKMCIFGITSPQARMSISPFLMYKNELTIIAVNINPFSFPKALGWIDAMGTRYLDYERLGIKTYSLRQHKEALEALKKGAIAKAIFKIK
ncbi:D-arabinitol dehydrogenase 1-like [Zootermopsis nevadensis]|uniref:Sorbitol dehydrogenase n=1 Tax=Zootermopsis nevadensis TaxID=136037 RepID=A0A067RIH2_ZOONE|nr:D-arabinitol dehydrogenase 1-like [Zootermopsis nevadensis]XP_021918371.1 D-arabinitol dehydrogenase 1-like [Zootermopsis nevadensis]XP_021918372.1 D-arabinitol dehydrogenase 1-like [Zootermopsis nevadensis]KDR20240.1 Sorbitol dehydrogenase [Zootermopsis nevadensis]